MGARTVVANRASPCRDDAPSPSIVTAPPVTAAIAKKYDAADASGSTSA